MEQFVSNVIFVNKYLQGVNKMMIYRFYYRFYIEQFWVLDGVSLN